MLPNNNGWYNTDVAIHFYGYDSMSGIDTITPDIIINTEGINQLATGIATDQAGNSVSFTVDKINIDKTLPLISINSPLEENVYLLNQKVLTGWSVVDDLSGTDSITGTTPSGAVIDTSSIGVKTFKIISEDKAGNNATKELIYYVHYNYSGVLDPLKKDGSSVSKLGSTIPVKFQLKDSSGIFITNAMAYIYVTKISSTIMGTEEAISVGEANIGNLFRYDNVNNQYIFNLGTKNLSIGTWQLSIKLDDGTINKINFSLR